MTETTGRHLGPLGRVADAVAGRMAQSVPPDVLLEHVDLDAVLDQVDVNHLLDRIDVNRVLDRVDMDRLLSRVDIEALLSDVQLEALVRRAGIPAIVAETTGNLAGSGADTVRRQLVSIDTVFGNTIDRLLRRHRDREEGPPGLVPRGEERVPGAERRMVADDAGGRREVVSGRYAGGITRALAFTIDLVIGLVSFTAVSAWGAWMWERLIDRDPPDLNGVWATVALLGWIGAYLFLATVIAGRTVGKALVGLRVVRRDGSAVSPGSALVRVVALPASTSFFALGLLWSLADRRRRTFHDVLARTVVVYDWGDRPAEISGPLTDFLRRREMDI